MSKFDNFEEGEVVPIEVVKAKPAPSPIPENLKEKHAEVVEKFIAPRVTISSVADDVMEKPVLKHPSNGFAAPAADVATPKAKAKRAPVKIDKRLIISGVGAVAAGLVIYAAFHVMKPKPVYVPAITAAPVAVVAAPVVAAPVVAPAPAPVVAQPMPVTPAPVVAPAPVVVQPAPVKVVRKPVHHERKLDAATLEGLRLLN